MSLKDDENDFPSLQRDQDDLAVFGLSSPPSMHKEQEQINIDYGDSDGDSDSDVIVIDTTPKMLAEKISADGDHLQGTQEQVRATKRQRTERTGNEEAESSMPLAEEIKNNNLAVAERLNSQESKPYYNSIFEGCNSSEPIEIDDDSDDEINDSNSNVWEGKSNSMAAENPITEETKRKSPETNNCNSSVKLRKPTMDSAKTIRETGSDSVMDKREEKENQIFQKDDNMKKVGNVNLVSSNVCMGVKKADSTAFTDSVTDTCVSNENCQNSDSSGVADEDATVSQPPFEVINLADDDSDNDDDNDAVTSIKEIFPLAGQKRHKDDTVRQESKGTSQTRNPAIEIIDVDEIDDMDCEVEDKRDYLRNDATGTRAEGNSYRPYSKPRFKPNRNTSVRIGQKEWNTVRTFRSILRNQKEQGQKKATFNHSIYNDLTPPNARSTENFSAFTENRFIFHPSNGRPEDHHTNTFLGMNLEDAHKEQERLLQKAAQRVRNQPAFHVANPSIQSKKVARAVRFPSMVRDVHLQHPDHFTYRDFYARLGLPRNATEVMVKSQYRRLARVYHPDRNIGKSDTKHKFQAVTEAYNHLMNTT